MHLSRQVRLVGIPGHGCGIGGGHAGLQQPHCLAESQNPPQRRRTVAVHRDALSLQIPCRPTDFTGHRVHCGSAAQAFGDVTQNGKSPRCGLAGGLVLEQAAGQRHQPGATDVGPQQFQVDPGVAYFDRRDPQQPRQHTRTKPDPRCHGTTLVADECGGVRTGHQHPTVHLDEVHTSVGQDPRAPRRVADPRALHQLAQPGRSR